MVARAPIPEPDTVDLEVKNLHRVLGGQVIHSHLSFGVRSGQILFVSGPSGCGKTVLLRCLSCLDPIDGGSITLNGNTPEQWGIPHWRALVHYVHQARIAHPGTPTEFYELVQGFATQKGRPRGDLASIVTSFGLEPQILKEPWQDLSVGAGAWEGWMGRKGGQAGRGLKTCRAVGVWSMSCRQAMTLAIPCLLPHASGLGNGVCQPASPSPAWISWTSWNRGCFPAMMFVLVCRPGRPPLQPPLRPPPPPTTTKKLTDQLRHRADRRSACRLPSRSR